MESEDMIIKKVSVLVLLDLLEELYDRGVDFVDVHGKRLTEDQDILGVSFSKNYMDPECIENFDTFEEEGEEPTERTESKENKEIKISLNDEDIDKLIG